MKTRILLLIAFVALSNVGTVAAQMTGADFRINTDSISVGGNNTSSGGPFELRDSIGTSAWGYSSGSDFILKSGFRAAIFDEIVTIDLAAQEKGVSTNVNSVVGTDITVVSSGSFGIGDYVILVQDESTTHQAAIGRVTGVAGLVVTTDELVSSVAMVIDGVDDVLYRADGSSISFGQLESANVTHNVIGWEVSADVPNGFNVFISEDGNLRNGLGSISDVADGTVVAGSEEYGGRSSDTTLLDSTFDTADTAITSIPAQIGSVLGTGFAKKGLVDLKASIDGSTLEGTYAQDLYIIAAPIY